MSTNSDIDVEMGAVPGPKRRRRKTAEPLVAQQVQPSNDAPAAQPQPSEPKQRKPRTQSPATDQRHISGFM